jgi:hypothetical protein
LYRPFEGIFVDGAEGKVEVDGGAERRVEIGGWYIWTDNKVPT